MEINKKGGKKGPSKIFKIANRLEVKSSKDRINSQYTKTDCFQPDL
jgi:hypothetical protein